MAEDKMDLVLFIKEISGDKVKIKEAEWDRKMAETDIPKCFGFPDDKDRECSICIIRDACSTWEKRQLAMKEASDIEKQADAGQEQVSEPDASRVEADAGQKELNKANVKEGTMDEKKNETNAAAPAAPADPAPAETPAPAAEEKKTRQTKKLSFEETVAKVKAKGPTSLTNMIALQLIDGGTIDAITANAIEFARSKNLKTFTSKKDLMTQIKWLEERGWVIALDVGDTAKWVGVN